MGLAGGVTKSQCKALSPLDDESRTTVDELYIYIIFFNVLIFIFYKDAEKKRNDEIQPSRYLETSINTEATNSIQDPKSKNEPNDGNY